MTTESKESSNLQPRNIVMWQLCVFLYVRCVLPFWILKSIKTLCRKNSNLKCKIEVIPFCERKNKLKHFKNMSILDLCPPAKMGLLGAPLSQKYFCIISSSLYVNMNLFEPKTSFNDLFKLLKPPFQQRCKIKYILSSSILWIVYLGIQWTLVS